MAEWVNYTPYVMGSSGSDGFGGGIGGLLVGALLGRGILGGDRGVVGEACVTPALLASSLASVTDNTNNSVILNKLGSIEAAIPYNEAQVQLALGQTQSFLATQANVNATAQAKAVSDATATVIAAESAVKDSVMNTAAANLTAILNSKFELANTVRDDGDKTRALIVAQNDATLNRELAVAQSALIEERGSRRVRDVEVNVSQTVNQAQAQAQTQAQLQGMFSRINDVCNDLQTIKQGQVIFNSGVMAASGTQAAANTKVWG